MDGTLLEAWAGLKSFRRTGAADAAAGRSRQSDGEFPRRTAVERDASVDDGSREPLLRKAKGHEAKLRTSATC